VFAVRRREQTMELQSAGSYAHHIRTHGRPPQVVRVDFGPVANLALANPCQYTVVVHYDLGDHTECVIFLEEMHVDAWLRRSGLPPHEWYRGRDVEGEADGTGE
jgi:hypothetical protein